MNREALIKNFRLKLDLVEEGQAIRIFAGNGESFDALVLEIGNDYLKIIKMGELYDFYESLLNTDMLNDGEYFTIQILI